MEIKSEVAVGIENLGNDTLNYVFSFLDNKSLTQLRKTSHFFQASTRKELIRRLEARLNSIKIITAKNNSFFIIEGRVWFCGINPFRLSGLDEWERYTPTLVPDLKDVQTVSADGSILFIVKKEGTVWGKGQNNFLGQLGLGDQFEVPNLTCISDLTDIADVSTSGGHTIFLKNDGTVWVCGHNAVGELGLGDKEKRVTPEKISGFTNVNAIMAADRKSVFLKKDGTVWVCGYNAEDRLGINGNQYLLKPEQIPELNDVKEIAGAHGHLIFLKKDGTVLVCGSNDYGQLGLSTMTGILKLQQIPELTGVKKIVTGDEYSLFLKEDGTVWRCGKNLNNQYASQNNFLFELKQISQLTDINTLVGSADHAIFFKKDGSFYSYGSNICGQLGLGHANNNLLPANEWSYGFNAWSQVQLTPKNTKNISGKIQSLSFEKAVSLLQKLKQEENEAISLQELQNMKHTNTSGQHTNKRKRDKDSEDNHFDQSSCSF